MDLKELFPKYGQSLWLDYIRRQLLNSGELKRLIEVDGVRGVTSNPSIFEKAIAGSTDYDTALAQLAAKPGLSTTAIYERLAVEDIQAAADLLRPLYESSQRGDGYVCMEVSPYLAHDTQGTLTEARRLWKAVARDNLMVKVPGTSEGVPAIRQLISEGINVNVTLLFSRAACRRVFDAYSEGLELLADKGGNLGQIASVASMFVSRIDALVDPLLEGPLAADGKQALRTRLIGRVAIANAKLAYQDWKEACATPRFQALVKQGAQPQRLLWASTGAKDPRFRDVIYMEALIGKDTVNTVPPATLDAFREHGNAQSRLEEDLAGARETLSSLEQLGISMDELTQRLLDEGVQQFSKAFDGLLASVEKKRSAALRTGAPSSAR